MQARIGTSSSFTLNITITITSFYLLVALQISADAVATRYRSMRGGSCSAWCHRLWQIPDNADDEKGKSAAR